MNVQGKAEIKHKSRKYQALPGAVKNSDYSILNKNIFPTHVSALTHTITFVQSPKPLKVLHDMYIAGNNVHLSTTVSIKKYNFKYKHRWPCSQTNNCRPPKSSHMEKTGFSCYAPMHIVHPSNKGKTTTQMFTMKYVQCLAPIILCCCNQFSKQSCHCPLPFCQKCLPLWKESTYCGNRKCKIYDGLCLNLLFILHICFPLCCGLFEHYPVFVPYAVVMFFLLSDFLIIHSICSVYIHRCTQRNANI